jgi:Immunity protein 7
VHLWVAGDHNHHTPDVLTFYEVVAATAPGSYGVLYTHDDEDGTNAWTRWVMRRGAVHPETDNSLSPHIGLVEDPWST